MIVYLISVTDRDGTQCHFYTHEGSALKGLGEIAGIAAPGSTIVLSEHKLGQTKGALARALNAVANPGPDIADRLGGKRNEIRTTTPG